MNLRRLAWLRAAPTQALVPLFFVLLVGAIFNSNGAFFEASSHWAMLREISVHGILACGMTVVIITAGIDLSVGSLVALCAVAFAWFTMPLGWGLPGALLLTLALGAAAGATSGLLVGRSKIQPFVVTLAMMVFARGLAKQISGGRKITNTIQNGDGSFSTVAHPEIFSWLDTKIFFHQVSVVTLIFFACVLLTWLVLNKLTLGRFLFALGDNPEAARLAGVPVRRSLLFAYCYCGVLSALAGICQAAQETQGDPETGMGYELDAIAMVVLGGTSLMGGRGGVGLTFLGALTLGYLQKILSPQCLQHGGALDADRSNHRGGCSLPAAPSAKLNA